MILRFSKMDTLQLISYIFNRQVRRPLRPCAKRKSNRFGLGGPITKLVQLQHDMCPRFFSSKITPPYSIVYGGQTNLPPPPSLPPSASFVLSCQFLLFSNKRWTPGRSPHPPSSPIFSHNRYIYILLNKYYFSIKRQLCTFGAFSATIPTAVLKIPLKGQCHEIFTIVFLFDFSYAKNSENFHLSVEFFNERILN